MSYNPTTTIRITPSLKNEANAVFQELGISMSTAINAFLANVARTGRIPFDFDTNAPSRNDFSSDAPLMHKNSTLNRAFKAKKDEFYTQYEDI